MMPPKRRTPPRAQSTKKKTPPKKAAGKTTAVGPAKPPKPAPPTTAVPPKVPPATGMLDQALVVNLNKAPKTMPPEAVVMETLRSVPVEQLKDALAKAPPKERHLAFSALTTDQIKSIVGTLPGAFLAPTEPPAPPPSPTGGPSSTILQTTYDNVPYPPAESDPDWAQKISDGNTVGLSTPPPWEWVSVYDTSREREGSLENPMVGLTGWVVMTEPIISNRDVWFVHPFGNDFQFFIAPDPQYEGLLGANNDGPDEDYAAGTQHARDLGLPAPKGVIGVETDHGLVPEPFQRLFQVGGDAVGDGMRIAAFGRWIVDCGHDDFHTEIHPPLLLAVAKPTPPPPGLQGASQMTRVEFISRPYTVSQKWDDGNFAQHLLHEVAKVESTFLGIPGSLRVEAHPTIFRQPYEGRPYVKLLVKPPVPRSHHGLTPQQLTVSFHFTHRGGVAVQVFDAGNDTVGIIIVFGDLTPAALPAKHDLTVQWDELGDKYSWVIDALQVIDILTLNIASAVVLNRGILTDIYDPPIAQSPLDNQNVATPTAIDHLQPGGGLSEDDGQPFPIYGWMNVYWQESGIVVQPPVAAG